MQFLCTQIWVYDRDLNINWRKTDGRVRSATVNRLTAKAASSSRYPRTQRGADSVPLPCSVCRHCHALQKAAAIGPPVAWRNNTFNFIRSASVPRPLSPLPFFISQQMWPSFVLVVVHRGQHVRVAPSPQSLHHFPSCLPVSAGHVHIAYYPATFLTLPTTVRS